MKQNSADKKMWAVVCLTRCVYYMWELLYLHGMAYKNFIMDGSHKGYHCDQGDG